MPNDHLQPDELAMRERCERAKSYRPGAWDAWALNCTSDLESLLTRLAAERAEVERLRGPQTLSIADDAPISGYTEYECFPGKLIACTGSVEIEIEETGHGGFGGCKHTIDFPGVKTVRQLRMLLEMLGTPTPAE